MPQHGGDLRQAVGDVGLAGRLQLGQQRKHVADLRAFALGRQAFANLFVEGDQADRVLLVDHQPAERGGQADAVFELGQFLAKRVAHRAAEIHHQVAGDVGFGLEFFDVVLVGLGVDEPVDVVRIVAGRVLAVLAELDGEAVKRAGVQALQKAADDELCAQIEPRDLANDFRLQIFFDGGHCDALNAQR